MIGHIDAIRMHNIQSWGEDNNVLDFEYTKVNVIIARNETGKSVMLKVFRQMCFPTFFGRTGRTDLIKRKCDYGHMDILTVDGYQVGFRMFHKTQIYFLRRPDGTQDQWVQDTLPEEVRNVLGWFVDEEEKILLNIIDHEIAMPLVETPSGFNARVLRFVVENQRLEDTVFNYRNWITEIDDMVRIENQRIDGLNSVMQSLPYMDTYKLERKKVSNQDLLSAYTEIQVVAEVVDRYIKEAPENNLKAPLTEDLDKEIEMIINNDSILNELEVSMNNLSNLKEPSFNFIDEQSFESIRKQDTSLYHLLKSLADLNNLIVNKPIEPKVDSSVESIIEMSPKLFYFARDMQDLLNNIQAKQNNETELANVNRNLKAIEEELGICPLCNKPFNQHEGNDLHE